MRLPILALSFLLGSAALQAQPLYYDLSFSSPVQSTNKTDSDLGAYYTGTTYDFRNVSPTSGTSIDLRVTITNNNPTNYNFIGSFPDYSSKTGQPDGDLGYLYEYSGGKNNYGAGGVTYKLDFFTGDGKFKTAFKLSDFRLMIYDVDGEASQSESVRVQDKDGFYGYSLPNVGGINVKKETGSYLFTGPGQNRDEDDPTGAFILYYHDTSSISLQMIANTFYGDGGTNGVFSAIDGDLSLIGGGGFGGVVPVPEPSSALLALFGTLIFMRRRR